MALADGDSLLTQTGTVNGIKAVVVPPTGGVVVTWRPLLNGGSDIRVRLVAADGSPTLLPKATGLAADDFLL